MNRYPLWKNLLIIIVLAIGVFYALPNIYGRSPVVQISAIKDAAVDENLVNKVKQQLADAGINNTQVNLDKDTLIVRFETLDDQFKGKEILNSLEDYKSALNLKPNVPEWLDKAGGKAMNLGLDLRGGVHFLMQVDMKEALENKSNQLRSDVTQILSKAKISKRSIKWQGDTLIVKFKNSDLASQAYDKLRREVTDLNLSQRDVDGEPAVSGTIRDIAIQEIKTKALEQNISTIRSRVNEYGVAEPIVQREGADRIVVQLPGVQDSSEIKGTLDTVATLEYRAVHSDLDLTFEVAEGKRKAPLGYKLYREDDGRPALLSTRIIVSGDQLIDATAGTDQQTGQPMVSVRLNNIGAKRMLEFTKDNVGNNMGVVFKSRVADHKDPETGKTVFKNVETVISNASINGVFSNRFQTSGGSMSDKDATKLALLLRAGALAAPVEIVAERTIGPSLGKENIDKGFQSVMIGFVFVLVFMLIYYRAFGVVANIALAFNVVLMVSLLSMLGATLTLPGIAGIVLTVGMAVDANVLIFERIKEELGAGNSPHGAISAGYEKALSTIADANITTFIAAIVLFAFGTGPIKGFAVTLSIGILTSMFTAIMVSRAIVNFWFGNKTKLKTLSI